MRLLFDKIGQNVYFLFFANIEITGFSSFEYTNIVQINWTPL